MKIDIHGHQYPAAFLKEFKRLVERGTLPRPAFDFQPWDIEKHLALNDEMGIDLQVLSLTMTAYPPDRTVALDLVQGANDGLAEASRRHPDRFIAFAALPLVDVDASVRELRRAVTELGMKGVILGTNVQGKSIDAEAFHPLYEEIHRRKLPVLIHPMDPKGPPQAYDYRLELWIGWPVDTAYATARLILSGVLDRFPGMTLILSHLGGATHYLLERIHHGGRYGRAERPVLDYYRKMYYDTAGPVSSAAVLCAHRLFGAERILFGTDYPFGGDGGKEFIQKAVDCVTDLSLPKREEEAIFSGNTRRLLGL
ncbi:MAG: amidohydrolase [Candidatus Tectomicrobia bacterium]|nr:amidohydrolase [Candidatus Tectomicrobia bacterium]